LRGEIEMKKAKKQELVRILKSQTGTTFLWTIIGVCATAIVAAFIFIPGLRTWSTTMMTDSTTWWNTIKTSIFQTA
jgi:hypothetical protein